MTRTTRLRIPSVSLVSLFSIALAVAVAPGARADEKTSPSGFAKATFAGGCFWCMQKPYDDLPGVVSTTVGYAGGSKSKPTYEEVSSGGTGHAESIQIVYDPKKVSYEKLLDVFWHNIDPFARNSQFCDHGTQYRSAIFFQDDAQKRAAEESKKTVQAGLKEPIATEITAAGTFWPAEDYHQSYYKKNPIRYKIYRSGCGRDARLKEIWGESAAAH